MCILVWSSPNNIRRYVMVKSCDFESVRPSHSMRGILNYARLFNISYTFLFQAQTKCTLLAQWNCQTLKSSYLISHLVRCKYFWCSKDRQRPFMDASSISQWGYTLQGNLYTLSMDRWVLDQNFIRIPLVLLNISLTFRNFDFHHDQRSFNSNLG